MTKSLAVSIGWWTPNHCSGENGPIDWEAPGRVLYGGP